MGCADMSCGANDKTKRFVQVSTGPTTPDIERILHANAALAAARGWKYVLVGDRRGECDITVDELLAQHPAARALLKGREGLLECLRCDVYRLAAAEMWAPVLYADRDCLVHESYKPGPDLEFAQHGKTIDHFMFYAPTPDMPIRILGILPTYWGARAGYGSTHNAVVAQYQGRCNVIGERHFSHLYAGGHN
jgi:hypothetical protein